MGNPAMNLRFLSACLVLTLFVGVVLTRGPSRRPGRAVASRMGTHPRRRRRPRRGRSGRACGGSCRFQDDSPTQGSVRPGGGQGRKGSGRPATTRPAPSWRGRRSGRAASGTSRREFEWLPGVKSAVSGYAGGHVPNPSYEMVHEGDTGHAEVVQVEYDPSVITYEQLLKVFWHGHDPTQWNRQGPDVGTQYRSVIFYHNEAQRKAALKSYRELTAARAFRAPIVTQLMPMKAFYRAEDYHQNYYGGKDDRPVGAHVAFAADRSKRGDEGHGGDCQGQSSRRRGPVAAKPAESARTATAVGAGGCRAESGAVTMEARTWIVDGVRTPMGAMNGALASIPAPRLGAACIEALLRADRGRGEPRRRGHHGQRDRRRPGPEPGAPGGDLRRAARIASARRPSARSAARASRPSCWPTRRSGSATPGSSSPAAWRA